MERRHRGKTVDMTNEGATVDGSPPLPPTRRRAATRERLLDAARDVFAERGIVGGTVEEICERAGFTRGAFYSNFGHKDELVRALLESEENELLGHLDTAIEYAAQGEDPLLEVVTRLLAAHPLDRRNYLVRSELSLLAVRDPEAARGYLAAEDAFRARLAPTLHAALARIGRRLTVDTDDAIDALQAVFETNMRRALLDGAELGGERDLALRVIPVVLAAVSAPVDSAAVSAPVDSAAVSAPVDSAAVSAPVD
jgi:AcrR family transcriptional regulator